MNVGNSVRKAIHDWGLREFDAAMLHACNAVDGTAKKLHPTLGSNARFTKLLRERYWILGPMGIPGIDLEATRWPVRVVNPKAGDGKPDLADVIYGVHRCSHGHGEELPDGFQLIPDAEGPPGRTRFGVQRGSVRLSDRIIFGLVAVAVLSPVNRDQKVPDGYHLIFGKNAEMLLINDWWGREDDFRAIVEAEPLPTVSMNFEEWMK